MADINQSGEVVESTSNGASEDLTPPVVSDDTVDGEVEEDLEPPEPVDEDASEETSEETPEEALSKEIEKQFKVSTEELQKELLDNDGSFTEDTYAKFDKQGYSKEFVDNILDNMKFANAQLEQSIYNHVGSKDNFDELTKFVQDNIDPKQIDAYNKAYRNKDLDKAKGWIDYFKSMQNRSKKGGVTRFKPTQTQVSSQRYKSREEFTQAISDPRFQNDPEYTDMVRRKAGAFFK